MRILDVLLLPDADELSLLFTPMLLAFDDPPFQRRGEVTEMFQQWLKVNSNFLFHMHFVDLFLTRGLEMMLEHNIAYRWEFSSLAHIFFANL